MRNKVKSTTICMIGDASSVHFQRWVEAMLSRNFHVHIITRNKWESCPTVQTEIVQGDSSLSWFTNIFKVRRAVRETQPDIIHAHYVTSYGFWGAICGFHPLVLTAWGTDILVTPKKSLLKRLLTKWTLQQADLITADSQQMLIEIQQYAPKAKLEIIQWGIDISRFNSDNKPVYKSIGPQIVSFRMWEPNYNIDIVLNGFKRFVDRWNGEPPHLHLIGSGSLNSQLNSMINKLDIRGLVTVHGFVSESKLIDILSISDISISIPTSDATAMSVLESMAAKLSIIASDLPDNHYWLGSTGGIIIYNNQANEVADALNHIASDVKLCQKMGERNHNKVLQEASRKTHMDRMANLYERLLTPQQT